MKNKLIKLVEKDGFILFLFGVVCLVTVSTLVMSLRNINTNKDVGDVDFVIVKEEQSDMEVINSAEDEDISMLDEMKDKDTTGNIQDVITEEQLETIISEDNLTKENMELTEETVNLTDDLEFEEFRENEANETIYTQSNENFILPVEGAITTEFTTNTLVYSKTLDSWVGHGGIDIEASEGTVVKAAADGVIKEVYEDELWGLVIVIEHKDNIQTKYIGVSTKDMIRVGLDVKQGDHISKIGNTARIEMLDNSHLHFEVIKNGKLVDPRSIMD